MDDYQRIVFILDKVKQKENEKKKKEKELNKTIKQKWKRMAWKEVNEILKKERKTQ